MEDNNICNSDTFKKAYKVLYVSKSSNYYISQFIQCGHKKFKIAVKREPLTCGDSGVSVTIYKYYENTCDFERLVGIDPVSDLNEPMSKYTIKTGGIIEDTGSEKIKECMDDVCDMIASIYG